MTIKSLIMPHLAATLSSPALKSARRGVHAARRRLRRHIHTLDVFLKLDDPYSFLLIQVLPQLSQRFDIDVHLHTVETLPAEMFPEQALWTQHAFDDAKWLSSIYELDFPSDVPSQSVASCLPALLEAEMRRDLHAMTTVFRAFWLGDSDLPSAAQTNETGARLAANEALLEKLGHYNSAMIYCDGEWYWGLDRLDHLESRLMEEGAARSTAESMRFNRTWKPLCSGDAESVAGDAKKPAELVMYLSARSPYSFLGLELAAALCERQQIDLIIKPVLPMVMRGMPVPKNKKMYIFLDTKREADKLGIPYGRVADPLGAGVERCYALFDYARSQGKERDFLLSFARRVNAEGVRSEMDSGMRQIVEQAGLDWREAKPLLATCHDAGAGWRDWAQKNLDELYRFGQWGVPCFRYRDLCVWGQDRLYRIEKKVRAEN